MAAVAADRTERWLDTRLDHAVADLESLLAQAEGDIASAQPSEVEREPGAVYTVLSGNGARVAPLPSLPRGPFWAERTVRLRDGALVSVAVPLAWWERILSNPWATELATLPLILLVALLTAHFATRRLSRPLRDLTEATERLAAENFKGKIPQPPGKDELARLARSFERARSTVQARLERERTFARYLSHELRTPLAALQLQVERASLPDGDLAEVAPRLARNVKRIEEVVVALGELALAHDRSTEESDDLAPVADLVALARDMAARGDVRLAISDASPPGAMVRHARLVRQAVLNLVDNALRHGARQAALRIWVDGARLELRVVDDGPGVPKDRLARLTEPFQRGPTSASGLGLGLSLVAAIAERLRGELTFRNREPGFEAALRLPNAVADGSDADAKGLTTPS